VRDEKCVKNFVVKPEGRRPLGMPRRSWTLIRMYVMETGWEVVNWIHLAQDKDQWRALVNTVMDIRIL
jgi:hypothetical protein